MPNSSKPPSKKAVIEWFRAKEIPRKAGFEQDRNAIATWFHGKCLNIYIMYLYIYVCEDIKLKIYIFFASIPTYKF